MAGKSVIGVDFGPSVVKLVEYSPSKKEVLTIAKLYLKPLELRNEKALFEKVTRWILEKKQSPQTELIMGLPAQQAVIRNVEEGLDKNNPVKSLEWELEQYISEPLGEYFYDYQADTSPSGAISYLIAAVKKTEANKYLEYLSHPALPLVLLDVDIFAAYNAFEANYPEELDQSVLILKADLHGIVCLRTARSRWLGIATVPVPENYSEMEEDNHKETVLSEMVAPLSSFLNKAEDSRPTKVFFCGDMAGDASFESAAQKALPLEWQNLNAFKKIVFPHDPEHQQKVLETAPQCATALGLALRNIGDRNGDSR